MRWWRKKEPDPEPIGLVTAKVLFRNGWEIKLHTPVTVTESDDTFRLEFGGSTTIIERDAVAYAWFRTALEEGGDG